MRTLSQIVQLTFDDLGIRDKYQAVVNDSHDTTWMIVSTTSQSINRAVVTHSGSGSVEDAKRFMDPEKAFILFIRLSLPPIPQPKTIAVHYLPQMRSSPLKGRSYGPTHPRVVGMALRQLLSRLEGIHKEFTFESLDQISTDAILGELWFLVETDALTLRVAVVDASEDRTSYRNHKVLINKASTVKRLNEELQRICSIPEHEQRLFIVSESTLEDMDVTDGMRFGEGLVKATEITDLSKTLSEYRIFTGDKLYVEHVTGLSTIFQEQNLARKIAKEKVLC